MLSSIILFIFVASVSAVCIIAAANSQNVKRVLYIILFIATIALGVFGKDFAEENSTIQTNTAIYENNGFVDEDGERYDVDWNLSNGTIVKVSYNTKGTITRTDDIPISYEILKEVENTENSEKLNIKTKLVK